MTELEKLFKGLPFNARDSEVIEWERKIADICYDYNYIKPSDPKRNELLEDLFGEFNSYSTIASGSGVSMVKTFISKDTLT